MKKYNIEDDPRYKLAEKILLETGVGIPMLTWSGMSEEELEAYYQELKNGFTKSTTISDVTESVKDAINTAANLICNLRELTGLSQQAFSDKYGIPRRTLQDWEYGRRTPPEYVIKLLKRVVEEDFVNKEI